MGLLSWCWDDLSEKTWRIKRDGIMKVATGISMGYFLFTIDDFSGSENFGGKLGSVGLWDDRINMG